MDEARNTQSPPEYPSPEPNGEPMMRYFTYSHLPGELQRISKLFHVTALAVVLAMPRSAERTVALRKLLEAKDAAVRAAVFDSPAQGGG